MSKTSVDRGSLAALALAVAVYARAASAASPDAFSAPPGGLEVGRGDEWIYETRDSQTDAALSTVDVVVTEKRENEIAIRMRISDANTGATRVGAATFDTYWRKAPDEISPGEGVQDSWGVRPKLRVGDEWNYRFERLLMGGPTRMTWIGHAEVLAGETLTLPGGRKFDTLKIEFFERPSVARYRYEMHVLEWFAPEANRYVKREVDSRLNGQIADDTTETLLDYIKR